MAGPIQWKSFTTAQGTPGEQAPDPDHPGQYLYYGQDGTVYRNSYPGEVHPGDVASSKVGTRASIDKQYQTDQYTGKSTAPSSSSSSGSSSNAVSPAYINPASVPQLNAKTVGALPSVAAQSVKGATAAPVANIDAQGIMNSSGLSTEDLSGGDFSTAIMNMLAPQFKNQQQQMNESLASAGISGGSTAGAQTELANAQNSQAQGLLQPELLQLLGLQNTRDTTVAGDLLAGATQNQNTQSANNQFNAGQLNQVGEFNSGQNLAAQDTNQATNLGAQEYNAGQQNTAGSFNIANLLQAASGNQNAYNQFLSEIQSQNEQTYLGDLGAVSGQAQTGQSIGTTRQPVYTQPSYSGMNFGSALGSLGGGTNATAQASA